MNHSDRANILAAFGANASETEELLAYNHNVFDHTSLRLSIDFPLASEPHVAVWEDYATTAKQVGVLEALKPRLVQLQFPIQAGISQTETYRTATRQGVPTKDLAEATGLQLRQPETLQLVIHPCLAGMIPVLITSNRDDFVTLVQAFTKRNEPEPIPASMGACIIGGFNNWHRIHDYRHQWEAQNPLNCSEEAWEAEFQRLIPQKERYQDRFIVLSDGFYSGVSASDMGLSESEWRQLSHTIRLEHECTHYFTRRVFNSMRNNLQDELIADYQGIVAAIGYYRSDWFLRFLGLEAFPTYRDGGRLQNYRGQPPLSDGAFSVLQRLVKTAAENLEQFDRQITNQSSSSIKQPLMLLVLSCLTLEELASQEALAKLSEGITRLQHALVPLGSSASIAS